MQGPINGLACTFRVVRDIGFHLIHLSTQIRVGVQLAACLATPFTGDDKNMGEILEGHVRRAITEAQVNTQLRCGACLGQQELIHWHNLFVSFVTGSCCLQKLRTHDCWLASPKREAMSLRT